MTEMTGWHVYMDAYAARAEAWRKCPSLGPFYQRRYEVCCELVGIDVSQPAHWGLRRAEAEIAHRYIIEFARSCAEMSSPFDGMLAAPRQIIGVWRRHDPAIKDVLAQQRQNYINVMVDFAKLLWGPCQQEVTDEQLAERGVGAKDAPDPAPPS